MALMVLRVGAALLSLGVLANAQEDLPVVDLGYRLQRASSFNETVGYYNFSNIRYAAPPLGDYRFNTPQLPENDRSSVYDGNSEGRICPQASGAWSEAAVSVVTNILLGIPSNSTRPPALTQEQLNAVPLPPQDPRTSEDCLFLDVFAPQRVFEEAGTGYGAPVMVWIYGGGYTGGTKNTGSPAGLFMRAEQDLVFVAMNYRLGAFGFLAGPTLQANGTANAGLLDQRFALEWVQKNIHLFGGDPNKVTVFGESAGGGSIMHQITAYGGLQKAPFQQAIPQSPGWAPLSSRYQQEQTYSSFLSFANASNLQELRGLDTEALITANFRQIYGANYGNFVYGPTVDGFFAPAQPGELLLHGHFDKSVRVMVGHNGNEGLLFTPPYITSDNAFREYVTEQLPLATTEVIDYIAETLYPPTYDGSLGYRNDVQRAALLLSESVFTCNSLYLGRAYGNKTYGYIFNVPPALHGQDVGYTYWTGGNTTEAGGGALNPFAVRNATVAVAMQEFFTSFAQEGRPNDGGVLANEFDMYGAESQVVSLNISSVTEVMDNSASARCEWWQLGLIA